MNTSNKPSELTHSQKLESDCFNIQSGQHVHFVGIGGISMSGLARILQSRDVHVSGSDEVDSSTVKSLRADGILVHVGHAKENIEGADLVVYTAAIRADNPEYVAAQAAHIPLMDRATLLGEIMRDFEKAIGVSGTHGKTTTTSMICAILLKADLDPTCHVGGVLPLLGGSVRAGHGPLFVTEACEYVDSFLKLYPTMAVITNIDADHLDYFKDLEAIESSFAAYAAKLPADGTLVVCGDDARARRVLAGAACTHKITYGLGSDNNWQAQDITYNELGHPRFTAMKNGRAFCTVELSMPGEHNILNALASIAACEAQGVSGETCALALSGSFGPKRRFELSGEVDGVTLVSDYSHHPTEVKMLLAAARLRHPKRILCVFQPHTYTRTKALFNEYLHAFDDADQVFLTDIYAAREKDPGDIRTQDLVQAIAAHHPHCTYAGPTLSDVADRVRAAWQPGDLVLVVGAGTVVGLIPLLKGETEN